MRLSLPLNALLVVSTTLMPLAVGATTITVNSPHDGLEADSYCTLRKAIIASNTDTAQGGCPAGNGTDTIVLTAIEYPLTLTGADEDAAATGDLDITDSVDIVGQGPGGGSDIDAFYDRVLDIDPNHIGGITVTLTHISIIDGGGVAQGGGIRNAGTLIMQDSSVELSSVTSSGSVPAEGGAIYNSGTLQMIHSGVQFNGAGSDAAGQALGGGIANSGTLILTNTVVDRNGAHAGSGAAGGGVASTGTLTMTDSEIAQNSVSTTEAAALASGGGIDAQTLTLTRTLVYNNRASATGGGDAAGAGLRVTDGTLVNSTLTGNTAPVSLAASGGTVTFSNDSIDGGIVTLVAGTTLVFQNTIVEGGCADLSGSGFMTVADDYNLDAADTCQMSGSDLRGIDPMLQGLEPHGGARLTRAPLIGSPVIDAGNPAIPGSGGGACETPDQRGETRPQGPRCDIGAFEAPVACPPAPRSGCAAASTGRSRVKLVDDTTDTKDQVRWTWSGGPFFASDFQTGFPYTNLAFCVYDGTGLRLRVEVPEIETCGTTSCWQLAHVGTPPPRLFYRNPLLTPNGVSVVKFTPGTGPDVRGKITLKGAGPNLHMMALGLTSPVVIQFAPEEGGIQCQEATFSAPTENDSRTFKAKSD